MPCRICKQAGHNARTHHRFVVSVRTKPTYDLALQPDVPEVLDDIIAKKEECSCPICMEPIGDNNKFVTACGHTFCGTCILTNFQRNTSCPLCRGEIAPNVEFEPMNEKFRRVFAPRELMDILHDRLGKTLTSIEQKLVDVAEKESSGESCPSISMALAQPILRSLLRYTQDLSDHVLENI